MIYELTAYLCVMSNEQEALPRLAEGYYLDNFHKLLGFVADKYHDILVEEEKGFVKEFSALSMDAQRLFTRLIMRRGPYFRTDKISYDEIIEIDEALEELEDQGFLMVNPREELEFALPLVSKPEMVELIEKTGFPQDLNNPKRYSKDVLLRSFLLEDEGAVWSMLEEHWTWIALLKTETVLLFRLLFFGNLYQGLSDFILEDIGVLRYEPYEIRSQDRLFRSRELLDKQIVLINLQNELWVAEEVQESETVLLVGEAVKQIEVEGELAARKSKILNRIGKYFERRKLFDRALGYYSLSHIKPAAERRIRLLDKLGDFRQALELSEEMKALSPDEEEVEFATRFVELMKKKLEQPYEKQRRQKFVTDDLVLEQVEEDRVEAVTLAHYESLGYTGSHTENQIWSALFGLIFWDIIFMPMPDVFFNPFQRGPMDLFTPDFALKRKKAIDKRLMEVSTSQSLTEDILQAYDDHEKTANHLVNWKYVSKEEINMALICIDRETLVLVFTKMAANLGEFRTGFPDLMLFKPEEESYLLVEVKGPGDQLRPNQRRWLRFFEQHGIPYRVAKVKWT